MAILERNSWFSYAKQGRKPQSLILLVSLSITFSNGDVVALHSQGDCDLNVPSCDFVGLKLQNSQLFGKVRLGQCSGSQIEGLQFIENHWHILWLTVVANHVTIGLNNQKSVFDLQCVPYSTNLDLHLRVGGINFVGNVSGITLNGKRLFLKLMK